MKRNARHALVLLVVLLTSACRHNVVPENPAAAAALTADAVVIRVNEFQAVVIQACGPGPECQAGSLPTPLARDIVQTCIDLRATLKAAPDGWRVTVKTAWNQAKPRFASITNQGIQTALASLDAPIGGL